MLVDVFYDYFLARNWQLYSPIPLSEYTATFYAGVQARRIELPAEEPERAAS